MCSLLKAKTFIGLSQDPQALDSMTFCLGRLAEDLRRGLEDICKSNQGDK